MKLFKMSTYILHQLWEEGRENHFRVVKGFPEGYRVHHVYMDPRSPETVNVVLWNEEDDHNEDFGGDVIVEEIRTNG